jgi:D-beta-D-heptose 7-phosphate kinase/D-beta-D-heptose 1-phosphate adenosyltransferase
MLDEYIWGQVRRISPEAPVPIVEARRRTFAPGGAANVAANIAGLGGQPFLASVVGRDPPGDQLCRELAARGVQTQGLLVDAGRPTTTKTRVIAHSQQVVRVDTEERAALRSEMEDALLGLLGGLVPRVDACILSDYAKGLVSARVAAELIALCREGHKPIVVDPKGTDYDKYRGATVITPNLLEAERALNREINGGPDLVQVGTRLARQMGCALLITCGAEGMSLFADGREPVHVTARARQVYDVTGAGDTVIATLALALAAGADLEEAMRLANAAAGIVVGKLGTAVVTLDELAAALDGSEAEAAG